MLKANFFIVISFLTLIVNNLFAQVSKPVLDAALIKDWVAVNNDIVISPLGDFICYSIKNQPRDAYTLVLQSTDNSWKEQIIVKQLPAKIVFSADDKKVVFNNDDTLIIWTLKSNFRINVYHVVSFKEALNSNTSWIAYMVAKEIKQLVLLNLIDGKKKIFNNAIDFAFNKSGTALAYKSKMSADSNEGTSLWMLRLNELHSFPVWSSINDRNTVIKGYNLDDSGSQIVFLLQTTLNSKSKLNCIGYFKIGMTEANIAIHDQKLDLNGFAVKEYTPKFSGSSKYIYFALGRKEEFRNNNVQYSSLDVWNYKDTFSQSVQLGRDPYIRTWEKNDYITVFNIQSERMVLLENDYENIVAIPERDDYVVVKFNDQGDRFWLDRDKYYIVDLKDGLRTDLNTQSQVGINQFWFGDGYLLFYDYNVKGQFFSFDLDTREVVNISAGIKSPLSIQDPFSDAVIKSPVGFAAWGQNKTVFVYDNYDVWLLDLRGLKKPINVTNAFGITNKIKFRFLEHNQTIVYSTKDELILTAFNSGNKFNGIYKTSVGASGAPECLTMGPWTIFHSMKNVLPINAAEFNQPLKPLKAALKNVWVIKKESALEAPNYFVTNDFKNFKALTNIQPQKEYNWLTSELISFKLPNGQICQGVLYKPENFNQARRYPLIINYYEQLSHRVFEFPNPEFQNTANVDIPWFVSRGYIVLTTDIYYRQSEQGKCAVECVEAAYRYLSTKSYVDSKRIAICGHSWGGTETNYLVANTRVFAAALQGAGACSDLISYGFGINGSEGQGLSNAEMRMGGTLWQRPKAWVENSPVFRADKVTTPFLILHPKSDRGWPQSVEIFTALRRLNKPVWMLQYDHGNHILMKEEDCLDFTIRATQFFNHYLKSAPAPSWMTRGIPARLKQIETGYAYDPSGNCGKDCKVCKYWNEKMKKDSIACWKEIEEKKVSEHWE